MREERMMKSLLTNIFCSLALACGLSAAMPATAQAQTTGERTVKYTVQPGETVLGIAHRHGTTLDHLLSLNPGLVADYVQSGQTIVVPYVPGGAEAAPTPAQREAARKAAAQVQTATSPVEQKPQVKIVYKEYTVKRKDTPYALAKANGITVDELMAANPSLAEKDAKLKKGTVIRIPVKETVAQPQFKGLSTVRAAVVLPFVGTGVVYERSVEFYRGFLMGVEELKNAGVNVEVRAYEEPADDVSIAQLVNRVKANSPDVVVGPLYPSHFTDVAALSAKDCKVVVPFSSKVPQVSYRPELYVVNTPEAYESTLAIDLFMNSFKKQTHVVVLQTTNGSKRTLTDALQRRLSAAGYDVSALPAALTAQQVVMNFAGKKKGDYILVPDDASATTMNQMLDKAKAVQQLLPDAHVSLLGYDSWISASEGNGRARFHEADTYVLTPNYYYPYTTAAKAFEENYRSHFRSGLLSCSPRMAPLGYDLARGFLGNLATYGHDYNTQTAKANTVAAQPKLQSEARFASVGEQGGYVSRSMWLVHFKKDMSIVKISAQ